MSEKQTIKLKQLASICDLTERRVQQLAKEGVMHPSGKRGEYLFLQSVNDYFKYLHNNSASNSTVLDYGEHRARKAKEEADKLERENKLAENEVLDLSVYSVLITEALLVQKRELESMELQLSHLLPGMTNSVREEIKRIAAKCHNAVLDLQVDDDSSIAEA